MRDTRGDYYEDTLLKRVQYVFSDENLEVSGKVCIFAYCVIIHAYESHSSYNDCIVGTAFNLSVLYY